MKVTSLDTKIADDLGLFGDDNYFLIVEFVKKYNLDFTKFNYDIYFESEGISINLYEIVSGIIKIPFLIINLLIIRNLSRKIYIQIDNLLYDRENDKKDLTFGDLLTSKLNGAFCLRKDINIELI